MTQEVTGQSEQNNELDEPPQSETQEEDLPPLEPLHIESLPPLLFEINNIRKAMIVAIILEDAKNYEQEHQEDSTEWLGMEYEVLKPVLLRKLGLIDRRQIDTTFGPNAKFLYTFCMRDCVGEIVTIRDGRLFIEKQQRGIVESYEYFLFEKEAQYPNPISFENVLPDNAEEVTAGYGLPLKMYLCWDLAKIFLDEEGRPLNIYVERPVLRKRYESNFGTTDDTFIYTLKKLEEDSFLKQIEGEPATARIQLADQAPDRLPVSKKSRIAHEAYAVLVAAKLQNLFLSYADIVERLLQHPDPEIRRFYVEVYIGEEGKERLAKTLRTKVLQPLITSTEGVFIALRGNLITLDDSNNCSLLIEVAQCLDAASSSAGLLQRRRKDSFYESFKEENDPEKALHAWNRSKQRSYRREARSEKESSEIIIDALQEQHMLTLAELANRLQRRSAQTWVLLKTMAERGLIIGSLEPQGHLIYRLPTKIEQRCLDEIAAGFPQVQRAIETLKTYTRYPSNAEDKSYIWEQYTFIIELITLAKRLEHPELDEIKQLKGKYIHEIRRLWIRKNIRETGREMGLSDYSLGILHDKASKIEDKGF